MRRQLRSRFATETMIPQVAVGRPTACPADARAQRPRQLGGRQGSTLCDVLIERWQSPRIPGGARPTSEWNGVTGGEKGWRDDSL